MLVLRTLAAWTALMPLVWAATPDIVATEDSVSEADIAAILATIEEVKAENDLVAVKARTSDVIESLQSACACLTLSVILSGQVFAQGSTTYTSEATYYWDKREALAPKCAFVPTNTASLAIGLFTIKTCQSKFAVRGGGHMPVKGAANIDNGVLIAMTKFNKVSVAADKKTVDTGAGNGWVTVYAALEEYGLYCIGGRLKSIGVAGLTLGGGINYLAAKYGLAADGVTAYEVVLSSGKVVIASATSNSDLFWALKGGGNNFGIVTKFTLKTYNIPSVGTSLNMYSGDQTSAFISAVTSQTLYQENYDLAAGAIPSLMFDPATEVASNMLMTFAVGTTATPPVFANYTSIPALFSNRAVSTPLVWHNQWDTPYQAQRIMFNMHSVAPDAENLKAMWETIKTDSLVLKSLSGFSVSVTIQPITKSTLAVAANNGIGNAMGSDRSKPAVWWALNVYWQEASDDAAVIAWAKKTTEKVHAANLAKGLGYNDIYIGDAGDWQDPIASYGTANIAKLKTVRAKYDSSLVFTKLCPGAFKIPA